MSVVSDKMSTTSNEIICEACNYKTTTRSCMNAHMTTVKHIRNAYHKMLQTNAEQQFKEALTDAKNEVSKIKNEMEIIKNEKAEIITKNAEMENLINHLKNQLAIKMAEKPASVIDDNESQISDSTTSNLSTEHKMYLYLFETLFGVRLIKFPGKGDKYNSEFHLIRSSFQYSYANWAIIPIHFTSHNLNPRITFGIPTQNMIRSSSIPQPFYKKFHVYLDPNDTRKAMSICGFDGINEYVILSY